MANSLPKNVGKLIGLGGKMRTGIVQKGVSVPVTMVTAAQVQTDVTAVITAEGNFNAARSAKKTAYNSFHTAESSLTDWLGVCRNVLAGRLGVRWSNEWAQAGFVNASTAVPVTIEGRIALALSLVNFFAANPSYEVASMDVTAAEGTTLRDAAVTAQQSVITTAQTQVQTGQSRDGAVAALVTTMGALINNLDSKLGPDDPRWLAFGLNMPATNTTPGQPQNVSAHADGAAAIVVSWDPTPLASRYRVRVRVAGSGLPYDLAASSVDPMARIASGAAGVTVEIIVQAVNGSQGVPSEPVLFTMPAANAPAAEAKAASLLPELAPLAAIAPNGNGNGNGSLAVSRLS